MTQVHEPPSPCSCRAASYMLVLLLVLESIFPGAAAKLTSSRNSTQAPHDTDSCSHYAKLLRLACAAYEGDCPRQVRTGLCKTWSSPFRGHLSIVLERPFFKASPGAAMAPPYSWLRGSAGGCRNRPSVLRLSRLPLKRGGPKAW